jgi:predicted ATPase/DNA-binding CsgD family transcriptional regulator
VWPVVPAVASSFVGRSGELRAVARLVAQERLVSVVGPGGCGKTRLVSEAVRSGAFGVHGFVELAAVRSGRALAPVVLARCGFRDEPGRSPLDRLRDRLGRAGGVLVLDNCEQIRDELAAMVAGLLRDCPGLQVLATSRVTLRVAGETVLSLGGLDSDGEAAALFLDRARRVQPALPTGPGTDAATRRICQLADRLPLAIELAASHARALSLADIEAGMAQRLRFLATHDPNALPQHRSLQASIAWSAELVGQGPRRVLAALSVFEGRFTLDAALAAAGPDGRAALESLVDHCLVQFDAGEGRYVLLDTIREFAATELGDGDTRREVYARLIGWVARLAAAASAGLGRAETEALSRVGHDDAAVRSVLAHAVATGADLELAAGIVVDLAFSWFLRGRCAEGRDWAARISAAQGSAPPGLAWANAFLTTYSGDLEVGLGLAEAAAEQAAAAGDAAIRARSLILVGIAWLFVDPAAAELVLAEAVRLAERAGDDWGQVEALQAKAYTHAFRTDHRSALDCADTSLPALTRLGHAQLWAWDAAIRAEVAAQTGDFEQACTYGRQAQRLAIGIGEPVSASTVLLPLVRALCQLGRTDEAAEVVAAHGSFLDTHPGLMAAEALGLADAITAAWAEPATAAVRIEQALGVATSAGVVLLGGEAIVWRAVTRLAGGDPEAARAAAEEALNWATAMGNREAACSAILARGVIQRVLGQDASEDAYRALAEAGEAGLRPLVPDALDLIAGLALDGGRVVVAARLHAASRRLRGEMGCVVSPLAALVRGKDEPAVAGRLGAAELAVAHEQGAALTSEGAIAYATRSRGRRARPSSGWASLTPTELDVVKLAAAGLGNRAIGGQLLITEGTVRTHLRHVFTKLGMRTRAELAAAAARREYHVPSADR